MILLIIKLPVNDIESVVDDIQALALRLRKARRDIYLFVGLKLNCFHLFNGTKVEILVTVTVFFWRSHWDILVKLEELL